MDSSELTKNKRNRVTANSLSGGGIARPHSNITMNTQVLSSFRLGSRLVSHNKYLVLPFCQPPLCDTDLGTEPEPPLPPIAQQGWATNIGKGGDDNEGNFTFNATDSLGNIYVVGSFGQNPINDPIKAYDFDFLNPSQIVQTTVGPASTLYATSGSYNIFLAKYNPLGDVIWVTKIVLDNTQTEVQIIPADITIDVNDNIYVSISGKAAISSSPSIYIEFYNVSNQATSYGKLLVPVQTGLIAGSNPESYGVLVKYSPNGDCQWVSKQQNIENVTGISQGTDYHSVSISGTNDVILTGRFGALTGSVPPSPLSPPYQLYLYEGATSSGPGAIITPVLYGYLQSNIINPGFIVKYDTTGQITWATKVEIEYNATFTSAPQNVPTRLSSNTTSGTDTYILINMITGYPKISYYNATGTLTIPGQVIVTGPIVLDNSLNAAANFASSMYIAKYNQTGQFQWSNYIKAGPFTGESIQGLDIKCDSIDGVYVTGNFTTRIGLYDFLNISGGTTVNVTPFAEITTSGVSGSSTGFLLKYDRNTGAAKWATQLWNPNFVSIIPKGIAIGTNNTVTITGLYNDVLTINSFVNATGPPNPPSTLPSITTTPYGDLALAGSTSSDIFVIQYDGNGQLQWATSIVNDVIGAASPQVFGISTDPNDDSINITGSQTAQLAFNDYLSGVGVGGGPITTSLWGKLPALGIGTDAFIVKYKSDGKVGL